MIPGDCPTPGCKSTLGAGECGFDHFGRLQWWCSQHTMELQGVRERITALLAQIEGMNRVLCHILHEHPAPPLPFKDCVRCEIEKTVREQGALLVQLIKRERELTGVEGV